MKVESLAMLAFLSILLVGVACGVPCTSGSPTDMYNTVKPMIQNAVSTYIIDHNVSLPPTLTGGSEVYVLVSTRGGDTVNCSILDICALIGTGELMRKVPDGVADYPSPNTMDNFWNASYPAYSDLLYGCENTGGEQHYLWVVDSVGDVYSVCDENFDGDWTDDPGAVTDQNESADGLHCYFEDCIWP